MNNKTGAVPNMQERFAEVFARLPEQDIEQFYAHYQLWVLQHRIPLLEKQIEALYEHLAENQQLFQTLQPPSIALAVLARLQSHGVNDTQLLDQMLERGEDWLDRMMQRLDYCEQVEDFIQGDYTQWCVNSLEGAYDWIDSVRGNQPTETSARLVTSDPGNETRTLLTEEILLQKLSLDDEEAMLDLSLKESAFELELPPEQTPLETLEVSSTEIRGGDAQAEMLALFLGQTDVSESTLEATSIEFETLDEPEPTNGHLIETTGARAAPWYSVRLDEDDPLDLDQNGVMNDWIKVLQADTIARIEAGETSLVEYSIAEATSSEELSETLLATSEETENLPTQIDIEMPASVEQETSVSEELLIAKFDFTKREYVSESEYNLESTPVVEEMEEEIVEVVEKTEEAAVLEEEAEEVEELAEEPGIQAMAEVEVEETAVQEEEEAELAEELVVQEVEEEEDEAKELVAQVVAEPEEDTDDVLVQEMEEEEQVEEIAAQEVIEEQIEEIVLQEAEEEEQVEEIVMQETEEEAEEIVSAIEESVLGEVEVTQEILEIEIEQAQATQEPEQAPIESIETVLINVPELLQTDPGETENPSSDKDKQIEIPEPVEISNSDSITSDVVVIEHSDTVTSEEFIRDETIMETILESTLTENTAEILAQEPLEIIAIASQELVVEPLSDEHNELRAEEELIEAEREDRIAEPGLLLESTNGDLNTTLVVEASDFTLQLESVTAEQVQEEVPAANVSEEVVEAQVQVEDFNEETDEIVVEDNVEESILHSVSTSEELVTPLSTAEASATASLAESVSAPLTVENSIPEASEGLIMAENIELVVPVENAKAFDELADSKIALDDDENAPPWYEFLETTPELNAGWKPEWQLEPTALPTAAMWESADVTSELTQPMPSVFKINSQSGEIQTLADSESADVETMKLAIPPVLSATVTGSPKQTEASSQVVAENEPSQVLERASMQQSAEVSVTETVSTIIETEQQSSTVEQTNSIEERVEEVRIVKTVEESSFTSGIVAQPLQWRETPTTPPITSPEPPKKPGFWQRLFGRK